MRTIHTTIDIDASPQRVWDVLIDFPRHASWNPFFAAVEGKPEVGSTLRIAARKDDGTEGMVFRPEVLDAEPGRRLRWKGKLFVRGLFDGTHDFRLEALEGGGTRFHHSEEFRGLLVPLFGGVLRDTEVGFRDFNDALARRVEGRMADCTS